MKTVEVFADVRCPFTHVGLRRLVERRSATGAEFVLHVRAWPLELVNHAPLSPHLIAEEVDELREQVAPDLFGGFDPARFAGSSLPALALAADAYRHGLDVGERVSLALRAACFERGEDIASGDALGAIAAAELGRPALPEGVEAVHADWQEGQRRGVIGSPHFFVDGESWFCPGLHIQRVGGRLHIRPDIERFEAFVAHCTGG